MEITEVRLKLVDDPENRLKAFCSVTFDGCFVVRDIKIIQRNDELFIAMPSRKMTTHCPQCRNKNCIQARFCNNCGSRLNPNNDVPKRLFADIAHPVNTRTRKLIQDHILTEYDLELERSHQPGYCSRYDDAEDSIAPSHLFDDHRPAIHKRPADEMSTDD